MKLSFFPVIAAVFVLSACVDEGMDPNVGSFERSTGLQIDNPDASEGTVRGQTGVDPAAANLVQCSNGRLYEDCRNAPLGY